MKIIILILYISALSSSEYIYIKSSITQEIKIRMIKGGSWRKSCPVDLTKLRYLQVTYQDFHDKSQIGELIVHEEVIQSVIKIFEELYTIKYPIHQMKLVADFKGSDYQSIEADNTSALNCRKMTTNKNKWSNHAYGRAIDINPIENPYISRKGYIAHERSLKYKKRLHNKNGDIADKAILLKNDKATKIFKKYGWSWGGDWKYTKDYQHFEFKK